MNKTGAPYMTNGSQDESNIVFKVCRERCTDFIYKNYRVLFKESESKVDVPNLMYYFAVINSNETL